MLTAHSVMQLSPSAKCSLVCLPPRLTILCSGGLGVGSLQQKPVGASCLVSCMAGCQQALRGRYTGYPSCADVNIVCGPSIRWHLRCVCYHLCWTGTQLHAMGNGTMYKEI
jgi:hypothetical protein